MSRGLEEIGNEALQTKRGLEVCFLFQAISDACVQLCSQAKRPKGNETATGEKRTVKRKGVGGDAGAE